MKQENNIEKNYYGDQAPTWKHFLIVLMVLGLITALSWIAWFNFGWFH